MNDLRATFLLLAAAFMAVAGCRADPGPPPLAGAKMSNSFALTAHDGRRLTGDAFAGKYRIVYFGYTFCPDICPVDLQLISAALRQFEQSDPARAARVQPIFITADPARDTQAVMADYVDNFHPRLIGLTGSADEIGRAARDHGVTFVRRDPGEGGNYLLDHSRYTVLYGPAGEPIAFLPHDQGPQGMIDALDRWVR
ncbi:MAG TPA: SCO family protein [Allosphingosinicella sp.]|jgi:protein SCO1/2